MIPGDRAFYPGSDVLVKPTIEHAFQHEQRVEALKMHPGVKVAYEGSGKIIGHTAKSADRAQADKLLALVWLVKGSKTFSWLALLVASVALAALVMRSGAHGTLVESTCVVAILFSIRRLSKR